MYLIYMHTSKTSGKSYIGKTIFVNNPNKRWKNGLGYPKRTQPAFYNAIQLYGWDDFEHRILENYIKTAEEACEREKYWISFYHTWVYDKLSGGYNLTQGGEGAYGHKLSDGVKQKLKEARLNQKNLSLDHNAGKKFYNNGVSCIMCVPGEEPDGFKPGRLLTAEQRERISQSMSKNNKKRKGKLLKVVIINNAQLKCVGSKNLDKYIKQGWKVYEKGTGGSIKHGSK